MRILKAVGMIGGLLAVVLGIFAISAPRAVAQYAFMTVAASGKTRAYGAPAYLKSKSYSATTTFTQVTTSPTVLGCVVINTAGAAGSTIKLYNATSVVASTVVASIDAAQVGQMFCYGVIFSGQLGIAIASGGAAPDITITYQGGL